MRYMRLTHYPADRINVTYPWIHHSGIFTAEELDKICEMLDTKDLTDGIVGDGETGGTLNLDVRKSKVKFHALTGDNAWVFERLSGAIQILNDNHYNLELNGYETFQYSEYSSEDTGKYEFHMDTMLGLPQNSNAYVNLDGTRKLSLSLLLNEPGVDFEGGEFEFNLGNEKDPVPVQFKRGDLIVFPSFLIHRVKEVTKGIRKSIVIWVVGPKFK